MNLKNKKILITGSDGFIGLHLKNSLSKFGANVAGYDLESGQDIQNTKKLEQFVKAGYDVIYHLAGLSGSKESNENLQKCLYINTFAAVNLMQLIVKFSPQTKIILSSTRLEYGKVRYLPVDENHPTIPTSSYGLSKLIATQCAQVFTKTKNLKFTSFRTSNVYGPHKKKKFLGYNLINFFIDQAKRNEDLTIFGNGNQLRDYLYIDDLITAFTKAISPKADGQVYNLGFGKGIKLKEMARLIVKNTGSGRLRFVKWPQEYEQVETGSYVSDITKIKKELNFNPRVDFNDGIKKTLIQMTND